MTENLKSCPFCGSEPVMLGEDDGMYQVVCMNCAANIDNYDYEKEVAAKKWNNRPIEDELNEKIEKLERENHILRLDLEEIARGFDVDGFDYTREGMMRIAKEALK